MAVWPPSRTSTLPALLAGVTAALLVVAGCGGASGDSGDAPEPSEVSTSTGSPEPDEEPGGGGGGNGEGPDEGEHDGPADDISVPDALDFSATQVSGAAFDARQLAGTDTVFWFWAPWCAECAAAAEDVEAAAAATPDVSFVGVAGLSSDLDAMQGFVDDYGLSFTQLADTDGGLYTRFGVAQQDTLVLVAAGGEVQTVPAYGDSVDVGALVADTFS